MFKTWSYSNLPKAEYAHRIISKKLRKDGLSNEVFEIMLHNLTLEEIIGLKLELSFTSTGKRKLLYLTLWSRLEEIVRTGIMYYFISISQTRHDLRNLLKVHISQIKKYETAYNTHIYWKYRAVHLTKLWRAGFRKLKDKWTKKSERKPYYHDYEDRQEFLNKKNKKIKE